MVSLNEKVNSKEVLPKKELSEKDRKIDTEIAKNLNELEYQLTRRYGVRIEEKIREAVNNLNLLTKYLNRVKLYLNDIIGPIKDMVDWFNEHNKEPPRLSTIYFTNLLYNT